MEYDNTNTGALYINDKKGNDKRPDRKGSINIDGVEYWLSGWLKTTKAGEPMLSLKVQLKEGQQRNTQGIAHKMNAPVQQRTQVRPEAFPSNFGDDEIPPF